MVKNNIVWRLIKLQHGVLNNDLFIFYNWSFNNWNIILFRHERNWRNMNDEEIKTLFNVVDKLEKRIFLLEKVLASHAKCIGEMRGEENELERSNN